MFNEYYVCEHNPFEKVILSLICTLFLYNLCEAIFFMIFPKVRQKCLCLQNSSIFSSHPFVICKFHCNHQGKFHFCILTKKNLYFLREFVMDFNRSGTSRVVTLNLFKVFDRFFGMLVFFTNASLMEFQIGYLVFLSFLRNRWLCVVVDVKFMQKYSVNAWVPEGSSHGRKLFLLYVNDLPDEGIYSIVINVVDATLCYNCDQASGLSKQQKLAWDPVDWGKKLLVGFIAGKTKFFHLDGVTIVVVLLRWVCYWRTIIF